MYKLFTIDLFINNKIFNFLLWYLRLSKVFLKRSSLQIFGLVILNFFSQLCLLLASALPLKIIILMGSERIPRYFPSFMLEFGKINLIYFLTVASILFWIIFMFSELISSKVCEYTSNKLILGSYGSIRLKRQKNIATKAYGHYIKSISDMTFSIAAFVLILFIYPAVGYVCVIYLISIYLFLAIVYSVNNSRKIAGIRQRVIGWIPASSNIGFFVAFVFMIFDYTNGTLPGLLHALVSVILSRQLLKGHMRALLGLNSLYNFRTRHIVEKCYVD